ncbi:type II toxin-antitoxin system Phd/YefM family antitoxin [Gloeobacter kilaueensis]|uniref:Prevent-host-death family protein n=1 Tax=Gloeobacter kilaueensis (strain ATCC BAA-2537 / CCAP 1431/1 / ULC 316 / JS1) TaxID=1183438 RepID=U5QSE8_GLOK1|nr:prevent-host-death family protein [Gloeobacter kilaueensis]AGY60594.1 prevent-host-death family protein [Gloeobacter kilaueensis JS1]
MTASILLKEAQARLSELLAGLAAGEEIILTEGGVTIGRLLKEPQPQTVRKLGTLRGTVLYMAPDFDAPLDEFAACME